MLLTPNSRIIHNPLVSTYGEGAQGADIWPIVEPILGNYHQIYIILVLAHWKKRLIGEWVPLQCVQHELSPCAVFHNFCWLSPVYRYSSRCTHIVRVTAFE